MHGLQSAILLLVLGQQKRAEADECFDAALRFAEAQGLNRIAKGSIGDPLEEELAVRMW